MIKKSFIIISLMMCHTLAQAVLVDATLSWEGRERAGFAMSGVIDSVLVNVGEKVKAGDVLAKLDNKPFDSVIKLSQAEINRLEPAIVDARFEFKQAEELFERTVLSEMELQKISGKYKALIAEQEIAIAKLQLAKWQASRAILKAQNDSYVFSSNLLAGMVISEENKADIYLELVSMKKASATAWLSSLQKSRLKSGDKLEVIIDGQTLQAEVKSVALEPDVKNLYQMIVVFYYTQMIEPGKLIKVSF